MGTEASQVEIIDIDGDGDDDVSIVFSSPSVASQHRRDTSRRGTSGGNAISVENYWDSMEDRDLELAIMASINTSGSRKRSFIDISGDSDFTGHYVQVQIRYSIFEPGESSNSAFPANHIIDIDDNDDSVLETFMCAICVEPKPLTESFHIKGCNHSCCSDCTRKYVATKLQQNIIRIPCPVSRCGGFLEPKHCRSIIPPEVFDRWGQALRETMIFATHKFDRLSKDCPIIVIIDD